jgi:hypothetical protein
VRSGGSSNTERAGRRETAASRQGVLSGIVVCDGESPLHGEGPDGSTQPAKETRAGHAGSGKHVPTSLRGIANRARESKHHRFRNLFGEVNVELLMHCWHDLNKDAASGVDGLTAETYALNLEENITDLAERVKAGRYRAKLVRRVYIPKENGKQRPLGIPALEDKLVQSGLRQTVERDLRTGLSRLQPRLPAGAQRQGGGDRACARAPVRRLPPRGGGRHPGLLRAHGP